MQTLDICGAREHNLRSVDLILPRERMIVFCGVSGSGKSSLAFDTLYAEGRRRYVEALSVQFGTERGAPPEVDRIDGLPPTIALAQRHGKSGPYATLGAMALIDPLLRVLFGRAGTLHCPRCGAPIVTVTHDQIVDALLVLPPETRLTLEAPVRLGDSPAAVVEEIHRSGFSRVRLGDEMFSIEEITPRMLHGLEQLRIVVDRIRIDPRREQISQRARLYDSVRLGMRAGKGALVAVAEGIEQTFVDRPLCIRDDLLLPALEPSLLSSAGAPGACPTCSGTGDLDGQTCESCGGDRLSEVARAVRWQGRSLPDLQRMPLSALQGALPPSSDAISAAVLPDLSRRLGQLTALGLGTLSLRRPADSLSSSELQRARLARQLAAPLSGVLYVLDEPTAGLDSPLASVVVGLMRDLVAAGNTVIAVEHSQSVIRAADHIVEFGPGAGVLGGNIVYQGDLAGLLAGETTTGRWLSGRETIAPRARPPSLPSTDVVADGWRREGGPVRIPRSRLVALTGPAASGKSRLLVLLAQSLSGEPPPRGIVVSGTDGLSRIVIADRSAARSVRSNPATYIGLWDTVRELLASAKDAAIRGLGPSAFSLAAPGGRCEACKGTGERRIDMGPLPELVSRCLACDGRKFERDVLEVRWKGLNAAELLDLSAEQARVILAGHPRLDEALRALIRVGLGYVPLGQPVHTLSGGEARRLVLARELARAARRGAHDTVYLIDDPTAGLHPADTRLLVSLLRDLTDEGATVWAATTDPLLVAAADERVWVGSQPREGFAVGDGL